MRLTLFAVLGVANALPRLIPSPLTSSQSPSSTDDSSVASLAGSSSAAVSPSAASRSDASPSPAPADNADPSPSATGYPSLSLPDPAESSSLRAAASSVGAAGAAAATSAPTGYPTLKDGAAPTETNNSPLPDVTGTQFYSMPLPVPFKKPALPAWGAFFSYSQAPIPTQTVQVNPAIFTASLGSQEDINQPPQVREYEFNLHYAAGWPSGYLRRMAVINNHFPGPLIEANQGDLVRIRVKNNLDHPQAIHWHGIRQNGTNEMDGVPGISQCPIPPGGEFTYEWTTVNEVGTYWYHSHYGNTLADGLVGGIVIHSKDDPLKQGVDYDEDRVVYLSDWMNDQSEVIIAEEENMLKPYRGVPFVAEPDAALINGVGQCNCAGAQRGVPCGINEPAEIRVERGKRYRFRLINHGGQGLIRFSVDGHVLRVIEADDLPVQPLELTEVPVGSGQRYSVVVTADRGAPGDAFWMRARVGTYCINPLATVNGHGVLRYTNPQGQVPPPAEGREPTSEQWPDLKIPNIALCRDLDEEHDLRPLVPNEVPGNARQSWILDALFGVFVHPTKHTPMIGFGMNGIMYKNYINNPLLRRVMDGLQIGGRNEVAAVSFAADGGSADIVLNVLDPPPIGHPFHLHGHPFYIVARGVGRVSRLTLPFIRKKTHNAIKRDTLMVGQWSYAIIRLPLNTPGVWPLHCHIGWHLASGKMAAVAVGPEKVRNFDRPKAWEDLCQGTDPNQLGPGRRSRIYAEWEQWAAVVNGSSTEHYDERFDYMLKP